ncbi:MAG: pilus assembly protein [Lentisphaeria bacterium]|nr:pilus assembly protein [Lentisphaeria bacterium]
MGHYAGNNKRNGEKGSAIIESLMTIMVLMLILFGLMQLFHVYLADNVAKFASFRGARSAAVGFADYLVNREAKIQAIPASGPMTAYRTSAEFGSAYSQFYYERTMVPRFMAGEQWLNYEYWGNSNELYHADYRCPSYGLLKGSGDSALNCECCDSCDVPSAVVGCNRFGDRVTVNFEFRNYPFRMPMYHAFTNEDSIDINAKTQLTNHSDSYLR